MRALDNFNSHITVSRPLMLDAAHVSRLNMLASEPLYGAARLASFLRKEAARLVVVPSHEMPDDVVNIGSDVIFRDEATGHVYSVTLAMPQDADIGARCVSVLTPVGTALIGRAEGAVIDYEFPVGTSRCLTILRVTRHVPEQYDVAISPREPSGRTSGAARDTGRSAARRGDTGRATFIRRAIAAALRRYQRAKAIAQFEGMSDHLLADIGVSRRDIPQVVDAMIEGGARGPSAPTPLQSTEAPGDQLRRAA
ncbi:MAG TPA: GreA/GreB family elongation factor [Amaricoccus sp.]|uniref:GreA/GreB family elongation factor n=1 Tax=Amaricoccus sp. TaxID=1872485 RepID=UPI002BE5B219|nr:GreA/GreB family elongation factor [Amaricoccus sp.]HMQ91677.1 GreA/GreB family elongation factor [Amaricoccus sp.]HMR52220.1 GreA/GreB family elongation factor [Amaricoccus sp.]HMT99072.1 GreA/GreB family elongation factor [Amaricoccus sp.]